mgnify:CR=1 FL=1
MLLRIACRMGERAFPNIRANGRRNFPCKQKRQRQLSVIGADIRKPCPLRDK